MSIFNNFSYKLFGVATVLFCYTGFSCVFAEGVVSGSVGSGISSQIPYPNDLTGIGGAGGIGGTGETEYLDFANVLTGAWTFAGTTTQNICSKGYYLSSCNQIVVGSNWLKGIKGKTMPDYYSYGSSSSDPIHMTNLRKFFAGHEPISVKKGNQSEEKILPSDYVSSRNTILTTFCTDGNNSLANIKCQKCPNDADITESSVEINNYDNSIIEDSWQIHTIADCYMSEFSDHTGTYIYSPSATAGSNNTAKRCYYSDNVQGDELVSD